MALDRRQFLARIGVGVAALTGATSTIGAAGRTLRPPPGVQLYTVRSLLESDFAGTIERLAALGVREVEFAGYHGRSPAQVRSVIEAAGIAAPSAHIAFDVLAGPGRQQALEDALTVGHRYVVVPWLPARDSADAWRRTADTLQQIGAAARTAGLRLAYHNHDFELRTVDGVLPLELLIRHTDPDAASFQFDVYWLRRAGHDAVHWITNHADRVEMLHLKDSGGPPDHVMCDVGAGTLDFAAILAAAERAGVRHAFIEHDRPADPLVTIRNGLSHLAGLDF